MEFRRVLCRSLLTATSWTSSTEDRLSAREQKLFAGRQGLLRRRNGRLRIINRRRGRRGFGAWFGRHGTIRIQSSRRDNRSEENTTELQSLMRISYAVFCLKKKQQHVLNE